MSRDERHTHSNDYREYETDSRPGDGPSKDQKAGTRGDGMHTQRVIGESCCNTTSVKMRYTFFYIGVRGLEKFDEL